MFTRSSMDGLRNQRQAPLAYRATLRGNISGVTSGCPLRSHFAYLCRQQASCGRFRAGRASPLPHNCREQAITRFDGVMSAITMLRQLAGTRLLQRTPWAGRDLTGIAETILVLLTSTALRENANRDLLYIASVRHDRQRYR
jgi:hypothetical protein